MKKTANGYILSTGREIHANQGLVSIARNSDGSLIVFEGYDGPLNIRYGHEDDHELGWTAEERRELADYMIGLWTAFKTGRG